VTLRLLLLLAVVVVANEDSPNQQKTAAKMDCRACIMQSGLYNSRRGGVWPVCSVSADPSPISLNTRRRYAAPAAAAEAED